MFGTTDLGLFIVAGLILNITPGVDLLYITSRSAAQGKKAGVVAALGIGTGCVVHVLAATCGLSVVLSSSALAFSIVKYLGAAYLLYLGVTTLIGLKKENAGSPAELKPVSLGAIYRQAIWINALNPKVALFFMALLPQFVSPAATTPSLSFLFLGVLFNVNAILVNILFALFTASLASRIKTAKSFSKFLKSLVGTLFIGLGIRLATIS